MSCWCFGWRNNGDDANWGSDAEEQFSASAHCQSLWESHRKGNALPRVTHAFLPFVDGKRRPRTASAKVWQWESDLGLLLSDSRGWFGGWHSRRFWGPFGRLGDASRCIRLSGGDPSNQGEAPTAGWRVGSLQSVIFLFWTAGLGCWDHRKHTDGNLCLALQQPD